MKNYFFEFLTYLKDQELFSIISVINALLLFFLLITCIDQVRMVFPLTHNAAFSSKFYVIPNSHQVSARIKILPETLYLFGQTDDRSSSFQSTSKWILRGIISGGSAEHSFVVIGSSNADENIYRTGSRLPDGSIVREIQQHAVILEQNHVLKKMQIEWNSNEKPFAQVKIHPLNVGQPFSLRKNP